MVTTYSMSASLPSKAHPPHPCEVWGKTPTGGRGQRYDTFAIRSVRLVVAAAATLYPPALAVGFVEHSGRCGSGAGREAPEAPFMPSLSITPTACAVSLLSRRAALRILPRRARMPCTSSHRAGSVEGKTRPPSLPSKQGLWRRRRKHDTQEALPSRHS